MEAELTEPARRVRGLLVSPRSRGPAVVSAAFPSQCYRHSASRASSAGDQASLRERPPRVLWMGVFSSLQKREFGFKPQENKGAVTSGTATVRGHPGGSAGRYPTLDISSGCDLGVRTLTRAMWGACLALSFCSCSLSKYIKILKNKNSSFTNDAIL